MRISEIKDVLKPLVASGLPALLVGAPGVGKSDAVAQTARELDADLLISHPAVSDPTDAKGLPWPDKKAESARFLPFGELARAVKATRRTIWFLDDLGQATPAVQASFMQLLLARRVNDHVLPDCVTFVAATNRKSDRAGVSGVLEPVKSRFATILEVTPHVDDWTAWAFEAGMPHELISFLRFRSELLHKFEPTLELRNSPNPRTWAYVGKMMLAGLPEGAELEVFKGAVGEGAAVEFVGYLRMARKVNLDAILLRPDAAPIPEEPSTLYATSIGLAARANGGNFARILQYCERLAKAGQPEFCALTVRQAITRCAELQDTADFTRFAVSETGKMFL